MTLALGVARGKWTTERGELTTWSLAGGIYATRAQGHIDVELVSKMVAAGDEVVREHGTLIGVHDWEGVTTYESVARKKLTDWGYAIRADVERVHFLTGSKLMRMGIAVASLVLGGMIVAYDDREQFEARLRDVIAERRSAVSTR
jgi:hypothetical protein